MFTPIGFKLQVLRTGLTYLNPIVAEILFVLLCVTLNASEGSVVKEL